MKQKLGNFLLMDTVASTINFPRKLCTVSIQLLEKTYLVLLRLSVAFFAPRAVLEAQDTAGGLIFASKRAVDSFFARMVCTGFSSTAGSVS